MHDGRAKKKNPWLKYCNKKNRLFYDLILPLSLRNKMAAAAATYHHLSLSSISQNPISKSKTQHFSSPRHSVSIFKPIFISISLHKSTNVVPIKTHDRRRFTCSNSLSSIPANTSQCEVPLWIVTKFVILDMGCCRTAYCFENNNNNNNHAVFRWVRWDWIKITIGFTGNSKFKRHICWCRWNLFNCQSKPLWFFHHTHRNKSAVW